jgi:hypothetical protein
MNPSLLRLTAQRLVNKPNKTQNKKPGASAPQKEKENEIKHRTSN